MAGNDAENAVVSAMGASQSPGFSVGLDGLSPTVGFSFGGETADGPNEAAWAAASTQDGVEGSVPMFNGKPIPPRYASSDNLRIIPAGPNGYRMDITSGGSTFPAEDADGNVLFFDLEKLVGAMQ
jgi:hypothetical protein